MKFKLLIPITAIALALVGSLFAQAESTTYINQEYVEIAKEMEQEKGISAALIVAMIETESSGQAEISNGNCTGLMQVDKTIWGKGKNLQNAYENIDTATDIMLLYMNDTDYPEELYHMLLEYNGGKAYADKTYKKWLDEYPNREYPSKYVKQVCTRAEELENEWYRY